MRHLLLLAPLLLVTPGCLTAGLWSWAHDEGTLSHPAVSIEEVTPAPDGGFTVRVRMADGSQQTEVWTGEDSRGPTYAFAEACRAARFERREEALEALARAVARGLQRRGFADEPSLSTVADDPEVARLDAEPVKLPSLVLRPVEASDPDTPTWVDVVHLAPPETPDTIFQVRPVQQAVNRGGPLGYTAAVLATPVTFAVDVATFPVQLALALWFLDSFFDLFE